MKRAVPGSPDNKTSKSGSAKEGPGKAGGVDRDAPAAAPAPSRDGGKSTAVPMIRRARLKSGQ